MPGPTVGAGRGGHPANRGRPVRLDTHTVKQGGFGKLPSRRGGPPPGRFPTPAAQTAPTGRLGTMHLRTVWRCGPDARSRERAHGLRRIPMLPGRNAGVRLRAALSGLGQDPTAPARGQSAPGLWTPPAKTPSLRAKIAQENGKNCRLTFRHPSVNIAPCLVRPENQFSLTRAALTTCGRPKSKFLSDIVYIAGIA